MNITTLSQDDLELYYDLTGDGSPGFRLYKELDRFNKNDNFTPKGLYREYDSLRTVLIMLYDKSRNNKFILGRDFDTARQAFSWASSQGVFAGSYIEFNELIDKENREVHIFLKKGIDDINKKRYDENETITTMLPVGNRG